MASYVFVSTDNTDKVIKGGPFVWDGTSPLTPPAGQTTLLASDAIAQGYTVPARPVADVNADTIRAKAAAAIGVNATYLALASPTNAQVSAQVKALTRECTGLIRLLLGQLDDTSDT